MPAESSANREPRWLAPLFAALALAHLVPVWSVTYFPTADGPAHLYNSWLLRELVGGTDDLIAQYFVVDWQPHPNWIGHAFLAMAMTVVPPLVAEKLYVSIIVLTFLGGAWLLAGAVDRRCRPYAFLAFPFAFHQLLQAGFYNFSLSVGLYLVIVGVWWRRRDRPDARTIGLVAVLLLLCYFSHPMSTALAIGSVGLLWLLTLRGRAFKRDVLHLLAIVPVLPLLAWFATHRGGGAVATDMSGRDLLRFLARTQILFTFDVEQFVFGGFLFGLLVALVVVTFVREKRRAADAFLAVTAVFVGLYAFAPSTFAGGQLLTERMALFIVLAPLPWLSPTLPRRLRLAVAVVMTLVTIGNGIYLTMRFRQFDALIARFVRGLERVQPNTTLLQLNFERQPPGTFIGVLSHAVGYAAIEQRLVDLDNYEPGTGYFPIAFRPDIVAPDVYQIETAPAETDIASWAPRAQQIYTWRLPPLSLIEQRVEQHYNLVHDSGDGRLYRSLVTRASATRGERILLPVAGTVHDRGAPGGAWWRIDQGLRNVGRAPLRVILNTCALTPCELALAPGQTTRIASADSKTPFVVAHVDRGRTGDLAVTTFVRRTDARGAQTAFELPAIPESAFGRERITIENVPFDPTSRANLRFWIFGAVKPSRFVVRARAAGRREELDVQSFAIATNGFFTTGDLVKHFPKLAGRTIRVDLDVEAEAPSGDTRVWGFVSTTENATEAVQQYFPRR